MRYTLLGCLAVVLQVIPRQLCDNAGFDATDVLNKLRQKHAHPSGRILRLKIACSWHPYFHSINGQV